MEKFLLLIIFVLAVGCGENDPPRYGYGYGSGAPQQLCERRIATCALRGRAIAVLNNARQNGYQAWIEEHGSILNDTRTYVLFAKVPCY